MVRVRTCLGCRQRVDSSALLRVVARDGVLIPDPSASLDGRGAWVHPTSECIDASIKRKAWGRALKSTSALDTTGLLATEGPKPRPHNEQAD
jgi:predicted RNA-binding protein YlxR (DUF448 family)